VERHFLSEGFMNKDLTPGAALAKLISAEISGDKKSREKAKKAFEKAQENWASDVTRNDPNVSVTIDGKRFSNGQYIKL
jgi:hypothetical protein